MLASVRSISTRDRPFSIVEIDNVNLPFVCLVIVAATVLTSAISPCTLIGRPTQPGENPG
jgi:hypothetical protein